MEKNIGQLLKEAARALNYSIDQFAAPYGLTGNQMSLIDFMSRQPSLTCSQQQVEHEFNIKRSTTTVMLQRMVAKGLLNQHPSATDGRKKVVTLTIKGQGLIGPVRSFIQEKDQHLLENLNPAEIAAFRRILVMIKEEAEHD